MATTIVNPAKSSSNKNQLVSTMIKQGFISDPLLSPSSHLSPPPFFSSPTPAQAQTKSIHSPTRLPNQSPTTLFEMMSEEQARESRKSSFEARSKAHHEKVIKILAQGPFGCLGSGDVKLTVAEHDGGYKVCMDVHKKMLVGKSRFFAEKLRKNGSHSVEILDCDDVEVYVETILLMYTDDNDLKKKLMAHDVSKVLELLKVSSAIQFDAGITSCSEYLEAIPWTEEEEEKIIPQLSHLHLNKSMTKILQRVIPDPSTSSKPDEIFFKLLTSVLQAKDEKARREMKLTISRLLKDEINISKDTLYHLCHGCLSSLVLCLSEATCIDEEETRNRGVLMGEIAREADNMQWIVDILINRKIGDEFVTLWAEQKELANLHSKIPTIYRHEISRITAQICIAIGRGVILVPKDTKYDLLCTWLEALYDDFGWMRRACRSIDKKLVEDGLSQTILTLPLPQQQSLLLDWFDRFVNKGDDCPNIQRAFEVWWRRAFVKQYVVEPHLQITISDFSN